MTFAELLKIISTQAGVSTPQARKVMEAIQPAIAEALSKTGSCRVPGLIGFLVKEIPRHQGWDPHSQKKMMVESTVSVKARPSKNLVDPLKAKYKAGELRFLNKSEI